MNKHQEFYHAIGKLIYSLAASDKRVAPQETDKMKELVAQQWLSLDDSTDPLGMDNAHIISISYELAMDEGMGAEEAFEEFREYYRSHQGMFTDKVKAAIPDTLKKVALAYNQANKAELVTISKLQFLFGE
jgi:hypothetical protein